MYKVSVIGNCYDPSKLCCDCRISATKLQANRESGWLGGGDSWTGDQNTTADSYFSIRSTPLLLLPTLILVSDPALCSTHSYFSISSSLCYFYPMLFQYQFHPSVISAHCYFDIRSILLLLLPTFISVSVGRSSQILKSKQCNPLICDIKEGHKASTQAKFH